MKLGQIFQPTDAEVDELVCRYPLAQVISCRSGNLSATPIPLLLSRGEDGAIDLLGHLSKANPQVADLAGGASVLIIFQGPDSYISPSWFRDRSRAPTWNYATAQFLATSEIYSDTENCNHTLGALAAAMEKVQPRPWTTAEMAGYEKSLLGIVTFKAKVPNNDFSYPAISAVVQGRG